MRGKPQGADCRDEKGDCGNQGKRKKRELTKTVSLKNCGAVGKENDFQIPSAHHETVIGSSRNFSMPDVAYGKNSYLHLFIRCCTQRTGKIACPFYIVTIPKMRWYSSEHCSAYSSAHCSDRTAKTLILRRSRQRKRRKIFHVHRKISDKIMQQIPQVSLTFDMTSGIITLI